MLNLFDTAETLLFSPLKTCPFCNTEAMVTRGSRDGCIRRPYVISCANRLCDIKIISHDKESLTKRWNTRIDSN